MTDKSLSLLDKIVNHTGKSARQLELIEEYLSKQSTLTNSSTIASDTISGNTSKTVKNADKYSAQSVERVSKSITDMTKSMLRYALVPARTKKSFLEFIEKYVQLIGKKIDTKGSQTLVDSLSLVGNSIAHIQLGLNGFNKISKKDEARFFNFIDKLIGKLFDNKDKLDAIDKNKTLEKLSNLTKNFAELGKKLKLENVEKTGVLLKKMAFSIVGFATAIFLGGAVLLASTVILIPVIGILWGLSKFYMFIGKNHKIIDKGTVAVKAMGWSLAIFGLGAGVLGLMTAINPIGIMAGLAILGISGAIYYFIGKGFGAIVKGALGVLAISLTLGVLAWSLKKIMDAKLENFDYKNFALVIGEIGAAYALAGLAIEFIVTGAVAIGLMGWTVGLFGNGVKKVIDSKISNFDYKNFGLVTGELIAAFTAAGVASLLIIPGAASFASMGKSLESISVGLKALEGINMSKFDPDKLGQLITGISGAFAAAGSTSGTKFNLFSFISGIELGPNAVERGIKSTLYAGESLSSIAKGLQAFESVADKFTYELDDKNSITKKILNITTVISAVFGAIGKDSNNTSSVWKAIFGTDFKKSDTEIGIKSVRDTGDALTSIAKGLVEFKNLKTLGIADNDFDSKVTGSIANNIFTIVGMINSIFAHIGSDSNNTSSVWKAIFGTDFKKSDTEIGINSVRNSGNTLTDIAKGLSAFKDLSKLGLSNSDFVINYDRNRRPLPGNLIGNIVTVLTTISSVFAEIGKKDSTWMPFGDGDVEDGIDAVQMSGDALMKFSGIFKSFAEIDQATYTRLYTEIPQMISVIPLTFAAVYEKIKGREDNIERTIGIFGTSSEIISSSLDVIAKNFEDKKFEYGYIGRLGIDIQRVMQEMTDSKNPERITNFQNFAKVMKDLSDITDPFKQFTSVFKEFSDSMGSLSTNISTMDVEKMQKIYEMQQAQSQSISPYAQSTNTTGGEGNILQSGASAVMSGLGELGNFIVGGIKDIFNGKSSVDATTTPVIQNNQIVPPSQQQNNTSLSSPVDLQHQRLVINELTVQKLIVVEKPNL